MRNGHPSVLGGLCIVLAMSLTFSIAAAAQDSPRRRRPDPSTPSPAHERMAFFQGTWAMEPGGYFQGGGTTPSAHEETCDWLPGGRRHMVCRSWRQQAGDSTRRESMYILSYRDADSTYVAHFAFPGGQTLVYHGRPDGDRWLMTLQPPPSWPARERLRTTITAIAGGGLRFVEEHSADGGPWKITEDYRYRRLR